MLNYRLLGHSHNSTESLSTENISAKPWLILLHGLFGMSDNLLVLGKLLAEEFQVLLPDLINHGNSPHRTLMDYPSMANDVFQLMDSMNIASASIIGHSMGGKVAMQMATDAPARVERLIVVDIAPVDYPPRHNGIFASMNSVARAKIASRKEADAMLANNIPELFIRQFLLKNLSKDDEGNWYWRMGLEEILDAYPAISAAPVFRHAYAGAVLFIKGERSDYLLKDHEPAIKTWFPNAQLRIVEGAGHWVHSDKPQVYHSLVKRFLK